MCVVAEVGKSVTEYKVGDVIAGLGFGSYATYMIIPDDDPKFVKVPETDKEKKYCLAEPLGCIVNIVKEASCKYGQNIAVTAAVSWPHDNRRSAQERRQAPLEAVDLWRTSWRCQKMGATESQPQERAGRRPRV